VELTSTLLNINNIKQSFVYDDVIVLGTNR